MKEEKRLSKLQGSVDDIIYRNENNGFVVLSLDTGNDLITVAGLLGDVEEGEDLSLTGEFVDHPKFGSQFSAKLCEKTLPKTVSAIKRYLSSGVIKGIGPVLAKKIVDIFKEDTFEIIANSPEQLLTIDGITPKKLDKIIDEFNKTFAIRNLMIFLSENNILPCYGIKIWNKYHENALELIKSNPYILCSYGIDLPFETAEDFAKKMNVSHFDGHRITAGISSVLQENSFEGHSCLPIDKLKSKCIEYLEIDEKVFDENIEKNVSDGNFVIYKKKNRDFLFLRDYFSAEKYISGRIKVMSRCVYDNEINFDDVIDIDEKRNNIEYGQMQRHAINTALSKGLMVLTGGPGTGKTTTLNAIISLFEQQGEKVLICAPTGKAAKRISEITGYDAKTIHRLLQFQPASNGNLVFNYNESNPLDCDVIVIDEMSMVDVLLFKSLLCALPLDVKMIMIGDSDQLPSVGAGNLLKDLIESEVIDVVKLTEIFRQAQKSKIVTNAHKIVKGEKPDLKSKDSDFFFMQRSSNQAVSETVVELLSTRLPNAYNFNVNNIQVLTPSRIGPLGTIELNKKLQEANNPHDNRQAEYKTLIYTFRNRDKVMQTKNNYEIEWKKGEEKGAGIFNGDIGTIIHIDRTSNTIKIDFDGRICIYNSGMIEHLELAYAITVHKSQGSEFDAVILPLFSGFSKLTYRNLLYTAVTRAKKILIIVGTVGEVYKMIENNKRTNRYSCLKSMLEERTDEDVIAQYL